ncbi:hypothetical protein AAC387_Pa02g1498 [Persea americana]
MASSSFVLYLLILLVYLNLQALECASSLGNETDRVALLAIKDQITSDPLSALSSWNGDLGLDKLLYETGYSLSHNQSDSFAIKGSIGYVPPEYGLGGQTSTKGDVYSYGILLLEMVTGRRPTDDMFKDGLSLHEFVKMTLSTQSTEIVDLRLFLGEGEAYFNNVNDKRAKILECLNSIVRLRVICSLELPEERMEMIDIVKTLQVVKDMFVGLNAF